MQNHIRRREKLFFLLLGGAFGIVLLVLGGYQLMEFTDSTAFCGQLCHNVMYPEYTAYQSSPHSRVECSECHVGPGAGYLVKSKLSGIPQIIAVVSNSFDRPISTPVHNLRPARETCEECHRPEKFSGDLVKVHTTFLTDENNTEQVDTRVLRVGGGEQDIASDIHWHVAAKVWFIADDKRQEISWVGVEDKDGTLTEYVDPQLAGKLDPGKIGNEKRLMDCVDCHNRATHIFRSPEELIDTAMVQGKIDRSLPYIKREATKALYPANPSLEQANAKLDAIKDFYRANYPQVFTQKSDAIRNAIGELKTVARLTTFPDMKLTWETYENNLGHEKSPGCFRCHGKLIVSDGAQKGRVVDANCQSCHYFSLDAISQKEPDRIKERTANAGM